MEPSTDISSENHPDLDASVVVVDSSPSDAQGKTDAPEATPSEIPPPEQENQHRCFVCLVDETDATLPADWCMPCTCSIEGHQDCLLAWVADLEEKGKGVQCPQCKSPIRVADRWDFAIDLDNKLNRWFSIVSSGTLIAFVASSLIVGSTAYGANAVSWFAGTDGLSALLLAPKPRSKRGFLSGLFGIAPPPNTDTGSEISLAGLAVLPFIAPALFVNRIDLGEIVAFPIALMSATVFTSSSDGTGAWPPSPARVFALYPTLKSSYFHLHRVLSRRLDKRWEEQAAALRLSQRADSSNNNPTPQTGPANPASAYDDDENADPIVPEIPPVQVEEQAGGRFLNWQFEIQIDDGDDPNVNANDNNDRPAAVQGPATGRSAMNFIAGTLLFPVVCFSAGEVLRAILPERLVVMPRWRRAPTGLLQQTWGRSFVGGCLFVVLKDAFMLYVKYRKTMNRSFRRVRNSPEGSRRRAAGGRA